MINHNIQNNVDSFLICHFPKRLKISDTTEIRINRVIIRNIITIINHWKCINRVKPNGINTQGFKIIQFRDYPLKIPRPFIAAVTKTLRINLINLINRRRTPPFSFYIIDIY
jgi:hypothetical protein